MPLVATVFHKMGGKGFSLGGGAPLSKLSAPPPPPHHSKLFLHQNTFLLHTTSEPINSKITNADQSIFLTPLPPIMDFIKQATGQGDNKEQKEGENKEQGGGGFLGGIGDKINSAAGGGKESEKNEDYLDKGVDAFQQHVLGQGDQSNESAVEQAKDEKISDFIRDKYKSSSGKEFPVDDKETKLG